MKICLISNLFEPYIVGGAEVLVAKLALALQAKCQEVVVVSTAPAPSRAVTEEEWRGIRILRFHPANFYPVLQSRRARWWVKPLWHLTDIWNPHAFAVLRRLLRRENPDIVHTHNIAGFSAAAWTAAKSLNIRVVHTLHDYYLVCPKATMFRDRRNCDQVCRSCSFFMHCRRRLAEQVDAVTSPTRFVLDAHVSRGFFPRAIRRMIRNAVDSATRETTNAAIQQCHFLYMGQLAAHKGVVVLLDAFRLMKGNAILHIAGTGPLAEDVKRRASGDDRIVYHGFVAGSDRQRLMDACHVAILPSLWQENGPMAVYEAYSQGMPVVASRIGGLAELVEDSKSGRLFEPGDVDGLAEVLEELARSPSEISHMRAYCLEKSRETSPLLQADRFLKIYEEAALARK